MQQDALKISEYIMLKEVQFLIFNEENNKSVRNGGWENVIKHPMFFQKLKEHVKYLTDNNYLEDIYKDNILNILDKLRTEYPNDVNEMIKQINSSNGEKCFEFYSYELSKRVPVTLMGKVINISEDSLRFSAINSICNDFIIISSIFNLDDETFKKEFIPIYSLDISYFYSLRVMANENDDIFLLKTMSNKLKLMLEYNKKYINKARIKSSLKRQIKSEIKVFEKCL